LLLFLFATIDSAQSCASRISLWSNDLYKILKGVNINVPLEKMNRTLKYSIFGYII